MAECSRFICNNCGKAVESWSDGNPYFIDEDRQKQHVYHPDHDALARCVGNDVPFFCLACGEEFEMDSRCPDACCPRCKSADTTETSDLDKKPCPVCRKGIFSIDPGFFAIS